MTRLNWGLIGGGEGSQIGPAHRLGALADGHFALVAGARLTTAPTPAAPMASVWASQRAAPTATGARCSRVNAPAPTARTL